MEKFLLDFSLMLHKQKRKVFVSTRICYLTDHNCTGGRVWQQSLKRRFKWSSLYQFKWLTASLTNAKLSLDKKIPGDDWRRNVEGKFSPLIAINVGFYSENMPACKTWREIDIPLPFPAPHTQEINAIELNWFCE